MSNLSVTVYEHRIDSPPSEFQQYNGFYNAIFNVEYHVDLQTPETPPAIIIDSITLSTVDYLDDKADMWKLFSPRNLSTELRDIILRLIDMEDIKEKAIDKAGTLTGYAFKQLI